VTVSGIQEVIDRILAGATSAGLIVRNVLADPRGYPREAMLLAVLAALLLLVIILAGFALADAVGSYRAWALVRVRRRPRYDLWAYAVLGITGLLLIGAILPMSPWVSARCTTCHAIDDQVATWNLGPHAGVSCYGCHARPGIGGAVEVSLTRAGHYIDFRTRADTETVVASRVFADGCIRCHGEIADGVVGEAVLMRHSDVIAAGYACERCHETAGHESLERERRVSASTMGLCLGCHDGTTAASACEVCHVESPMDSAVSPGAGAVRVAIRCTGCHDDATDRRCVDCHGLVLPHPADFMGEHARISANEPGLCESCHGETARTACGCHTDTNEHGTFDQWFPRHGTAAKMTNGGGCNCHETRFCQFCHKESPF